MDLKIQRETIMQKVGDFLMLPLMYLLQGNLFESPQRTHRWNNTKYVTESVRHLEADMMVSIVGEKKASERWYGKLPLFHMPIIGGWREYIVLEPAITQNEWYVGWVAGDLIGVSNVNLQKRVRVLKGRGSAQFFALNEHSEQIKLMCVGTGVVGVRSEYSCIPML